jgi:apolipoprotein D and lipocalin family protein
MTLIAACLLVAATGTLTGSVAQAVRPIVKTVDQLELERYFGKWYEIVRIENEFQIGCRATTAEYSQNEDQTLQVTKSCLVGDGSQTRIKRANGRAWIDDSSSNAKMKVSFVRFLGWWKMFAVDHWILELGPVNEQGQYSFSLVGSKDRKYGWILSREPEMSEATLHEVFALAERQGYDRAQFRRTDQSANLPR